MKELMGKRRRCIAEGSEDCDLEGGTVQEGLDLTMDEVVEEEIERLLQMQEVDGSWGDCWIYQYVKRDVKMGNRGLTSVIVGRALRFSGAGGGGGVRDLVER